MTRKQILFEYLVNLCQKGEHAIFFADYEIVIFSLGLMLTQATWIRFLRGRGGCLYRRATLDPGAPPQSEATDNQVFLEEGGTTWVNLCELKHNYM